MHVDLAIEETFEKKEKQKVRLDCDFATDKGGKKVRAVVDDSESDKCVFGLVFGAFYSTFGVIYAFPKIVIMHFYSSKFGYTCCI